MMMKGKQAYLNNSGQAATEFTIAAVFLLVPLFLFIPLIGKYIDINHALIQQARYEVWEYTAWFGSSEFDDGQNKENNIYWTSSDERTDSKSFATVRAEGLSYFFSDPTSNSYGTSSASTFSMNPLWTDQHGDTLFLTSNGGQSGSQKEEDTPDTILFGVTTTLFDIMDTVYSLYGSALTFLGVDAGFFAIYDKGFFTTDLSISVRSPDMVVPQLTLGDASTPGGTALVFEAKGSVLSNYWDAGSTSAAVAESKGLVVTAIFDAFLKYIREPIAWLNNLFDSIPLLDVKLPNVPTMGYMDDDLVPYEHLDESDSDGNQDKHHELKKEEGLHYYEEVDD